MLQPLKALVKWIATDTSKGVGVALVTMGLFTINESVAKQISSKVTPPRSSATPSPVPQ